MVTLFTRTRVFFCLSLEGLFVVVAFVVDGLGSVLGSGCCAAGHGQRAGSVVGA